MAKTDILPHEAVEITRAAIEGLIKGYSNDDLRSKLTVLYPTITEENLTKTIKTALVTIKNQTLVDIDKIIPQHIELYEKIYQFADGFNFVAGKLKTMKGKERLAGLHRESNVIEIYNEVNVEIESGSEYDISKLTSQEQKRLNELIKKIEK